MVKNIERYRRVINRNVMQMDGTLDYARVMLSVEKLANLIADTETDETVWYLGEFDLDLGSLIAGAFWHFAEHSKGQWSDEYRTYCALSRVFNPGMTSGPEPDTTEFDFYQQLNEMAKP